MDTNLLAVVGLIVVALVFDYINGFHDAANSIATVVSTRVLSPGKAVIWAAFFNFVAAFTFGTAVAKTVGSGLVDIRIVTLLGDLRRADRRDRLGPDHLVLRAADQLVARADRRLRRRGGRQGGLRAIIPAGWTKTLIFIVLAPLIGMVLGFLIMVAILWIFRRFSPVAGRSAGSAGCSSVGGRLQPGPRRQRRAEDDGDHRRRAVRRRLHQLDFRIPILWVILMAHAAIALGTLSGGWRIIHTMGSKITKLQPVGGFAAETAGAISLFTATHLGVPVSTTHTITGAIIGVGSIRRLSAVRWGVAGRIVWAWILTIPAAARSSPRSPTGSTARTRRRAVSCRSRHDRSAGLAGNSIVKIGAALGRFAARTPVRRAARPGA